MTCAFGSPKTPPTVGKGRNPAKAYASQKRRLRFVKEGMKTSSRFHRASRIPQLQHPCGLQTILRPYSPTRFPEEPQDYGASPAVLDGSLRAADRNDFSVHIRTDTINEFGFCEDTMAVIGDRTVHMYHTGGSGGGHAPDFLRVNGYANVLPSSTNPSNPFTPAGLDEGVPMTMFAHFLNFGIPEDVAFAEARVRPQTMAAEDMLHDMGAISIFATDTQGMGRLAENVAKCWQLASVMKDRVGRLAEERTVRADNERIERYVAKYTVNPAIAAGIDAHVESIRSGRMADLVIWPRASFGIKPFLVIKGGFVAWSIVGDGNGSIFMAEPMVQKPMWGALGRAKNWFSAVFVSKLALESGAQRKLDTQKPWLPISSVRGLRKTDMVRSDALPSVEVNTQTFECFADGRRLWAEPVIRVPLSRKYMLR